MFSGEPIDATRAETIGLVQAAIPGEDLDAYVLRYAWLLASRSPRTARTLKRIVYQGLESPLADGLALEHSALAGLFAGADHAEGLAAFAEKRTPLFQD
jgi:enoyl-CoA hydratase/carnithine racemase